MVNKVIFRILKVTIIVLAVLLVLDFPTDAQAAPSGRFTRVKGQVTIKRGSADTKARVGMKVFPGNIITTGNGARVKLLMSDRTIINLGPKSRMRVKRYQSEPKKKLRKSSFDLVYGKARAKVPKNGKNDIRFRTPTAVAGVRGTELIIIFNESTGETTVISMDGTVNVYDPSGAGGIVLRPGMATNILEGGLPTSPFVFDPGLLAGLRTEFRSRMNAPGDVKKTIEVPPPGTDEYNEFLQGLGGVGPPGGSTIINVVVEDEPGQAVSPEDMLDQEPPPLTPVIIDIYLP